MTVPHDLFEVARQARARAHCPYSRFQVGAAIRLSNGAIFGGCNVENASYGATICAERGAILGAVAAQGAISITEILVISAGSPPWPPCGMCRQVVSEFAAPDCVLHCVNDAGQALSQPFEAIFPRGFDASFLNPTRE